MPKRLPPIPDPAVVRVMREYREMLEAMELGVMEDMARQWLVIEARLANDIAALAEAALRLVEAGEPVSQQIIWRMETYKRMKVRLEEEIRKYNLEYLVPKITEEQVSFGMLGVESAQAAIGASYTTTIGPWFPVIDRGQVETMAGLLSNGSPLYKLLKNDYPDALQGMLDALMYGIGKGKGPKEVAKEMANGMGMGLERATLIARTEINRTYRTASVEQYRKSGVVTGFKRLVKKVTACLACLMLDGEVFPVEDYLDDHPAGKCVAIPIIANIRQPRWETGRQWFENLSPEEQAERMGKERYALWEDGKFDLGDLAKRTENETWGRSPRVARLSELVEAELLPGLLAEVRGSEMPRD